ncbi:MAG: hypothetical protein N5P05_004461 (plasmid) [Chroococcopsis gigantea SAG 12.99]|jgi:archaellum component FlaC|nr:hypothetical protein [Chlorogloea purpurea SAG 13.99]MDV3002806.1 hypothetical protein [Chroococcopsis gigantea SAG 12.99]
MSQTSITVTYDIKELFTNLEKKIDDRFDKLDNRLDRLESEVKEIKTDLAGVKGDIKALTTEVTTIKTDVNDLKGSQRYQIWALIGILATGVIGLLWRSFTIKP